MGLSLVALLLAAVTPAKAVNQWRQSPAEAVQPLKAALAASPLIAGPLKVLLADALLAAGEPGQARMVAAQLLVEDPRWANQARWIAARAAVATDCASALTHLDRLEPAPPEITAAARLALAARAHTACGQEDAAADLQRSLAIEHPTTPEGRRAAAALTLTAPERLQQAAAYEAARDYPSARALLEAELGGPLAVEARFALGRLILERVREDYDVAVGHFEAVVAAEGELAEEARWLGARSRGRAGDLEGALEGFRAYLQRYPSGRFAADAEFFGAFLRYEGGRYPRAARGFAGITRGKWRRAAAWYHAWCLYLAGDAKAIRALDRLAGKARAGTRRARRAAYWAARALEKRSPRKARRRRKALVRERPHDWYGLLLRRRFPKEFGAIAGPGPRSAPPAEPPPELAAELRALAQAGLPAFAAQALAGASLGLRARDQWDAEARLAREIGDWERCYRATAVKHHARFRQVPVQGEGWFWRNAWPRGFRAPVETWAAKHAVEPGLVWTFIRKESAFAPRAVSRAHAVGLMQLLPRTANAIRAAQGRPEASVDLFDPAVNVELGAWYVAALQKRFGGQLPLVAAAYNAGPRSLLGWFGGRASAEVDVFVETIPFKETREYVKRVVETRVTYAWVHEGEDLDRAAARLPTRLDLVVSDGVDF